MIELNWAGFACFIRDGFGGRLAVTTSIRISYRISSRRGDNHFLINLLHGSSLPVPGIILFQFLAGGISVSLAKAAIMAIFDDRLRKVTNDLLLALIDADFDATGRIDRKRVPSAVQYNCRQTVGESLQHRKTAAFIETGGRDDIMRGKYLAKHGAWNVPAEGDDRFQTQTFHQIPQTLPLWPVAHNCQIHRAGFNP